MIKELLNRLRRPKLTEPPPSPRETGFCWYRCDQVREARSLIIVLDRASRELSRYWVYFN